MKAVVRVHKKGIVVLPKGIRDEVGVEEGSLLQVEVRDGSIVLKPLDLWDRVWGCAEGRGSAEEAELELDEEEGRFWLERGGGRSS